MRFASASDLFGRRALARVEVGPGLDKEILECWGEPCAGTPSQPILRERSGDSLFSVQLFYDLGQKVEQKQSSGRWWPDQVREVSRKAVLASCFRLFATYSVQNTATSRLKPLGPCFRLS